METYCLYHNDADGRSSAAIVRRALGKNVRLYEINYSDPIPWESILKAAHIVIVDFCLPHPDMLRIAQERRLTWIDHHKSSINEMADVSAGWPGVRDLNQAACVLTWQYFFPEHPLPRAILLIGDRDTWRNAEPDSAAFGEGLNQQDAQPNHDKFWKPLLDDDPQAIQGLIQQGSLLREVRLKDIRRFVSRYGYALTFEGYSTLAVNRRGDGDLGQYIRDLGYQIGYCYVEGDQEGKLMTFVTLFSDQVDVSEIAKRFSGGGHPGAAGFTFERNFLPFPPEASIKPLIR